MNSTIKNLVGVAAALALLAGIWQGSQFVRYYSQSTAPNASYRSFGVSADGKVVAIPDIAEFSFSVITDGKKDITKIQKENTDKVNLAIDFLKKNGIDGKDIQTANYSLEPQYQYFSCGPDGACPPPQIVGYTIRQTVSVKIRNFDKIGDILSGVVSQGVNSVDGPTFTIDDPSKLQDDARGQAIQKAQKRAQATARAAGFTLGRLLSIEENNQTPPPVVPMAFEAKGGVGGAPSTPTIEPGSQEITISVTLHYEIL